MTSIRSAFDLLLQVNSITKSTRCGLIVDVDGTISPLVESPEAATVSPECKTQLIRLVEELPLVAALSGRPAADVQRIVDVPGMVYVGTHGLERVVDGKVRLDPAASPWLGKISACLSRATHALAGLPGLSFEDKGAMATIHYRQSPDPELAREAILRWASEDASWQGLEVVEGKMVVELRPPIKVDKGVTVQGLVQEYGLGGIIFLGDDVTDARAFASLRSLREAGVCKTVAVAVVDAETPPEVMAQADCMVRGVGQVAVFLAVLADLLSLPS